MDNGKRLYLTLDFEEDLGSATVENTYHSHRGSEEFIAYIKNNNLKVTLFITGEILDQHSKLLDPYLKENCFDFQFHSYNHANVYDEPERRIENIRKGLEIYRSFFGNTPSFYRAPDGVVARKDLGYLIESGIKNGSNFFPTFFPGRFNNLHVPCGPFTIRGTDYTEIPFSVTRCLKIPVALSYIQLFGLDLFKVLLGLEAPRYIIFDFHLHDLFPGYWYDKIKVPLKHRAGHYRMSRGNYAFATFEKVIDYFKSHGFRSDQLSSLTGTLDKKMLKEVTFDDIFK